MRKKSLRKKAIGITFTLQLSCPNVHCNYLYPAENLIEIPLTSCLVHRNTVYSSGKLWNTLLVKKLNQTPGK